VVDKAQIIEKKVSFERGYEVHIMAIDGTWCRACILNGISALGAELTTKSSLEGLSLNEFFLVLSTTGLAYRRCKLDRIDGHRMAVTFLISANKKPRADAH
jgi:hypothetical protein